jgi:hypothetical protein
MQLLRIASVTAVLLASIASSAQQRAVDQKYGKLPLYFEANLGQAASHVNFVSRNKGYTALLIAGNLTLSMKTGSATRKTGISEEGRAQRRAIQMKLVGAAKNPVFAGENPQPGRVNYFLGNNPANWRRNVPIYGSVRYKSVYPGIDLLYYGNRGSMEFDFELQSGAAASQIQFEIQGADNVTLDSNGMLVLTVGAGSLQIQSPRVYQEINGQRVAVKGGYVLSGTSHVAFKLAEYDTNRPLVIDPVLVYSTYFGGSGNDQVTGISVDSSGNAYVAGYTDSTDFPLASQGSLPPGSDHIFVSKLDPTGSTVVYTDYIGGNAQDYAFALTLNGSNEVYVTGSTASSDFPVVNAYQSSLPGSFNGFLTRISADGSSLLYSSYFGGSGPDMPASIALDSAANILIAGNTASTNFPVVNAYQPIVSPNQGGLYGNYGFITKFKADGSSLVFSTYLAGSSNIALNCGGTPCWPEPFNAITGIAIDSAGSAYVAGNTNTYNFPTTPGAYLTTNSAQFDSPVSFVSKLDANGSLLDSTYFYDASGFTNINAIAVDSADSIYISGVGISDATFPVTATGICDPTVYGIACSYAFVTKFDATGSTLVYSTFLGPNNYANPSSLVLDANNNAYVLASTSSSSFGLVNGIEGYAGGNDLAVVEIDPAAGSEINATYIGGSTDERAIGMALDANGNLYVAGTTDSPDFPATEGAFQTQAQGNTDAFILKIGNASSPAVTLTSYALQFPSVQIGTSSAAQQVLLRNMGSAPLAMSAITASPSFTETDNCGTSVPAAGTCSLSITFSPTMSGTANGSIAIPDNASGSPHVILVSGTGNGPVVSLSSSTLTFPGTGVGTTSAAQTITLANQGNADLTIANILINGDYAQTNNCPGTLSPLSNCSINVVFAPTTTGVRSGAVTIDDNVSTSPQIASLSGIGFQSAPAVSLSASTLTFSGIPVGVTSASQAVTLTNQGNASLTINSIQTSGDYVQTNNCPSTLTSQSTCTINVAFTPAATGTRTGSLTINDNAAGSPQSVSLSGVGLGPAIVLSSTALTFPAMPIGVTSASQMVTVTNQGTASLTVSGIQVSGDFSQTNNCSAALSSQFGCTIKITFVPTVAGNRTGALTVSSNAAGNPQIVALSGAGADFGVTTSQSIATVKSGASATYTVSIASVGAPFTNAINLSCSGAPSLTTCNLSSSSVTPGANPDNVTVTIATTGSSSQLASTDSERNRVAFAFWVSFAGIGPLGLALGGAKRFRRKPIVLLALCLTAMTLGFMTGCAGGTGIASQGKTGTTPGTYTVTITGTSGNLKHSLPLTLTVQ